MDERKIMPYGAKLTLEKEGDQNKFEDKGIC
jgi:hypothetical protein